jgi:hypothetical protein
MDIPRARGETGYMYGIRRDFITSRIDWHDIGELITYSFIHLHKTLYGTLYESNVELWYKQMLEGDS